MKFSLFSIKDIISGGDIFRIASPFLYAALLLHLGLIGHSLYWKLAYGSALAACILVTLLLVALGRCFWWRTPGIRRSAVLSEFFFLLLALIALTQQTETAALSSTWLIAVSGIFPLALRGILAFALVIVTVLIAVILGLNMGMPSGDILSCLFQIAFVGMLAILLSRVLRFNLAAVKQARIHHARFEAIARVTQNVFLITDEQFNVIFINPAIKEIVGHSPQDILTHRLLPVVHPDDLSEYQEKLHSLRKDGSGSVFFRHRIQHKDGHWVWLETRGYNMLHDNAINGLVFSTQDISARLSAERKLEDEHALLRAVLDQNPSMIYATDIEGRFTISNRSFQRRLGYASEDELRGKTTYDVMLTQVSEAQKPTAYKLAAESYRQDLSVIESGEPLRGMEIQGLWKRNVHRWYRTNKYPLHDSQGNPIGILNTTRDITESKEYESKLRYQAHHDPLTGLPNRRYLLEKVAESIASKPQSPDDYAMLFCDLDFFKNVNDTHGHEFGDKCLKELSKRLLSQLCNSDFVARFGGDEFVIFVKSDLFCATIKAQALLHALTAPLILDEVVVKVGASIGIALLRPDHATPMELIRDADAAMYQAKELGRNRAETFDASMRKSTARRAQMDIALRFALERNEMVLMYQPKACLQDGSLTGFETLLRWNHPEFGAISPSEFIPIAEETGLIVPIGLWVLEQACKQLSAWQAKYHCSDDVTVAVNVSMRQLLQTTFMPEVRRILESSRVRPRSMMLEITETAVMANPLQAIENLTMLKKLGLLLALDDFGTGYSSLAYLQKLPIDVIKIDKAFIQGLGKHEGDAEIVRLIIAFANTLDLETIAEGVENEEHIKQLKKLGCSQGQGFVFSPAVSAAEAAALLASPLQYALQ